LRKLAEFLVNFEEAKTESLFATFDQDKSGSLDREEFTRLFFMIWDMDA